MTSDQIQIARGGIAQLHTDGHHEAADLLTEALDEAIAQRRRTAASSAAYDEPQEWTPERIRREFERARAGFPVEGADYREALAPNYIHPVMSMAEAYGLDRESALMLLVLKQAEVIGKNYRIAYGAVVRDGLPTKFQ